MAQEGIARWLGRALERTPAQQSSPSARAVGYGIAIVLVAVAFGARELIGPAHLGLQFVTFFPAVALTAVYGGFGAGMLAMAISAGLATFFYLPPYRAFPFDFQPATVMSNLAFFLDELLVCGAIQAMHNHHRNFRIASERLAEKRNLLDAIVEGTTDAIFLKDREGRYLHCNAAHLRMTGKTLDDVVGNDSYSFFPAAQARALAAEDRQIIETGKTETYEQVIELPTRDVRTFLTTKGPVFDEVGNISGTFGIARDITEHKQAEEVIRDSEARYRSLFDHMQEILVYGRMIYEDGQPIDFTLLEVNPAFERLTGFTNAAGKKISDVVPGIRTTDPELLAICGEVAAGAAPKKYERYAPVIKNWVSVSIYCPAPEHFVAVFDVITEKKRAEAARHESEELNRRIIASSSDCIKVLDLAGNLLSMSEGGQRLLEIADIGPYLGGGWIDFWQAQDRPIVSEAIATARAGGHGHFQAYCPSEKGTPKWWDVVVSPIVGASGETETLLAVSRDVTDRKVAEDELRAAKAEAERANRAKSRFLAAASHDLRQPLTALSIYVGLLGDKLAPNDKRLFGNMKDCVSSLAGLLNDLLDLSKLEAGAVKANPSDFDVGENLAKLISAHGPEAQLKGLQLRYRDTALAARTDSVLFERIVGNLVANAIRYTERGGVLVGCRRHQGRVWVEVWDTGIGIPADKTHEIFEEFKQLGDDARNRGSGLGLAIVAKTAALLGLRIRVGSRLGRGSMFAVEVPLGRLGKALAPAIAPHRSRAGRIAVVEDNAIVLNALVYGLQNAGHEVLAAATGQELMARLDGDAPDVVVADYRLANGETGFDVIAAARTAFGNDLPAVIITGDTDPNLMRSMADRGILIQHKPLKFEALRACVEEVISRTASKGVCVSAA